MNTQRYLIASIGAAIWMFLYGFVVNAILLRDYWEAGSTAPLMRAEDEVMMWAIVLSYLLQGFALGFIFTKNYENKGIGEGVRFGLLVAWFIAGLYFLFFALQPVELADNLLATAVDGIMYTGTGVVLSLLYKK